MADTARRVFCRTCGKEVSIHDAKAYNTGRKTQYECYECHIRGTAKARDFQISVVEKFNKEKRK